jgi:hypothetical protein
VIILLNMFYNGTMPKKVAEEIRKEFQIGFRITRLQRERLDAVIARIKAKDKRVKDTEIYEELMSIKEPEFITEKDRLWLWSGTATSERKHGPGRPIDDLGPGTPIMPTKKKSA